VSPLQIFDPRRGISRRHIPSGGTMSPVSAVTLLFVSDWPSTGTSDAILMDSTKPRPWTERNQNAGNSTEQIRSASGLGFPATVTNILETDAHGSTFVDVRVANAWPSPAITDVMLYRLGLQFVIPDSYSIGGNDNHPIEPYPGATAFEWGWEFAPSQNGKMTPLWNTAGGGRRYFATDGLNKSQFYWLEWKFIPTGSAGVYKSRMRFVDVNGTVILTDADLRESGANHTWTQDDPSLTLDDLALRSLTVGDNGPGSWSVVTPGTVFNRFSTVAVGKSNASNVWIGPYVPGEHT
jgi:hypothetical protein